MFCFVFGLVHQPIDCTESLVIILVIIKRLDCGIQPVKAFGISACRPIRKQISLILRWNQALGFHK